MRFKVLNPVNQVKVHVSKRERKRSTDRKRPTEIQIAIVQRIHSHPDPIFLRLNEQHMKTHAHTKKQDKGLLSVPFKKKKNQTL